MTRQTVTEVADGVATVAGMPFDATTGLHTRMPSVLWIEEETAANLAACQEQLDIAAAAEAMAALLEASDDQLASIATELAAAAAALVA